MHRSSRRLSNRVVVVAVLVASAVMQFLPQSAAAAFTSAYMRLDRMQTSTATGGLVCAMPSSASTALTEAKVIVTFPSTYTLNTTASNWTVTTTNLPAGSTIWPGIGTATAIDNTNKTATFPSTDLTAGTQYCFNFASVSTVTTAAVAAVSQQASIQTQTAASAVIDLTAIALANIASDQITVSAVVPPSFSFALSNSADSFGNLNPTAVVSTAGVTVTIITNAKGGWITWAKDTQQGLRSTTASYTIPTTGTVDGTSSQLTAGTEGYLLDSLLTTDTTGGCTLAIAGEYDGSTQITPLSSGGTLSANYQPVASCTGGTTGLSSGDVITLAERAAISGTTPAASDYSDIITVVGAGNF